MRSADAKGGPWPPIRHRLVVGLLALAGAGCATVTAIPAPAPSVTVSSLEIDATGLRAHATLEFLAAYELRGSDPRFGGFSAIETDGERLWLLSDRAVLWRADLALDGATGALRLDNWRVGAIIGDDDDESALDSEALARLADGTLIAAFEHDDSLRRLVPMEDGGWRTERLHAGRLIEGAPRNRGLEAAAALDGGILLALSEGARAAPGLARGALLADGAIPPFAYRVGEGFSPVAAATAADGLFVLERSLGLLAGWRSRLVHVPAGRPAEGAVLEGEELLRITAGPVAENYEGVAALPLADGSVLVLLVSDDNQSALQRSLLLVFRHRG